MTGALIILTALVLVGGILYLLHLRDMRRGTAGEPTLPPMADPPVPANAFTSPAFFSMARNT